MIIRMDRKGLSLSLSYEPSCAAPGTLGLPLEKEMDADHLTKQLIRISHPVFLECLPEEAVELVLSASIQEGHEGIKAAIDDYATILRETNAFLLKIRHLKNVARSWDRVLFYRIDGDERFTDLCRDAEAAFPERVALLDGKSGFDSYERCWKPSAHVATESLIEHILSEKAGRVVSTNFYYSSAMLRERHLFIPAIMHYLGVELVSYDVDIYDPLPSGYLYKAALTDGEDRRFSFFPHMQAAWDDLFSLKNISYTITYRQTGDSQTIKDLDAGHEILVMTNSRLDVVRSHIVPLLYMLQGTEPQSAYHDFRLRFYALRQMILEADLPLYIRLQRGAGLYTLYVAGMSFFKLETLWELKTRRRLCIYGDQDWGTVFPEYYQGRYLNEQEKDGVFAEARHLYLLLNENFSYLECHPVIQDAVCRNVPFLTFPPIVRLPEFDGMRHMEYVRGDELSVKVEGINDRLHLPEFRQAIQSLKTMWDTCRRELVGGIMGRGGLSGQREFDSWRQRHESVFQPLLQDYRRKHEQDIRRSYEVLFEGSTTSFQSEQSRYFDRPYLQAILKLGQ